MGMPCVHTRMKHSEHNPNAVPCCTEHCPVGCRRAIIYGELQNHLRVCHAGETATILQFPKIPRKGD